MGDMETEIAPSIAQLFVSFVGLIGLILAVSIFAYLLGQMMERIIE